VTGRGTLRRTSSSAIALGTINRSIDGVGGDSNSPQSLTVSAIPVGATLNAGRTTDNAAGWSRSTWYAAAAVAMSVTRVVTAVGQDAQGNTSGATATVHPPSSGYHDGLANAPSGTPELPNLFSGDAVRPPWKVAGVDYHVGVPSGIVLKAPTSSNMPAGASLSGQNITVTGNNVTISGFDFSGNGGYGIYIEPGASGTRIINNLFVDSSKSGPIPVNIAFGASDTYVAYNTINGGGVNGNQRFDETIYNLGTGLTVEYNFIENAPGRFVSTGAGPLVYAFNLLENGGWHPGVHLNFLQFGGGNIINPQVQFNTVVQNETIANGEGFQMYNNTAGSITSGVISNNTMISIPAVAQSGASGPALSYLIHAGSNSQYPSPATGVVQDNYMDIGSAYGAFYPGLSGFTYSGNINLRNGTRF
jgi:hypothetical protein